MSWNPVTGCSRISEGCKNCYAAAMNTRFGEKEWNGELTFHKKRLDEPIREKRPHRIFVCSVSDFFHENMDPDWQLAVYQTMNLAPWHTYIFLTKRAPSMEEQLHGSTLPTNWWYGVSAENQEQFMLRWVHLKDVPAAVRFVSVEPMLGPVDITSSVYPDWVIVGPENAGKQSRPCDPAWIDRLQKQCRALDIPFFDKREGLLWTRREIPTPRRIAA